MLLPVKVLANLAPSTFPQKLKFWGVNKRFHAKHAKYENFILSKLLHRFQPNFTKR